MKNTLKALVIEQVPHEGLGTISRVLGKKNISTEVIKVHAGDKVPDTLSGTDLLIVLGGPMGVYDEDKYPFIASELRLIKEALTKGLPTLGICLGAQLMARAAGARVYKGSVEGRTKEIGWYDIEFTEAAKEDKVFSGLGSVMRVFQWHGDTFDVPDGATLLAGSSEFPHQLLRLGESAYALQFHLEVDEEMIYEWLAVEENVSEVEALGGAPYIEEVKKATKDSIDELINNGVKVFEKFLDLVS